MNTLTWTPGTLYAGGVFAGAGSLPLMHLAAITADTTRITGVDPASWRSGLTARATPNLFRDHVDVELSPPSRRCSATEVFDVSGRRIRRLPSRLHPSGRSAIRWDGRDDRGVRPRDGIYFLRISGPGLEATRRVILAR